MPLPAEGVGGYLLKLNRFGIALRILTVARFRDSQLEVVRAALDEIAGRRDRRRCLRLAAPEGCLFDVDLDDTLSLSGEYISP